MAWPGRRAPSGLEPVVDRWLGSLPLRERFVLDVTLKAEPERSVPLPASLAPGLRAALAARGVTALYAHQAEAFGAARAGLHVAVATPTASGKSLCFHLPVLQALAEDPESRALYLFPTKALARDQEASLGALAAAAGLGAVAAAYDGDTPAEARRALRERSPVIVTNPDMLHAGILPRHTEWARLFQRLRYVVLDEVHAYRGVFGSHVANVLVRLLRVAAFHGSRPTFVCASATIGNVAEHVARLTGVPAASLRVVAKSGAPRGDRRLLVYDPPVLDERTGLRASYLKEGVRLAGDLLSARVPTLVFAQSRTSVELVLRYLRERCRDALGEGAVMGYRGGYLASARREVERGLREGRLVGVVATSALELGVDVGALDAVVCLGFPGSVAGLWQRFGRAGRRLAPSLALLVASGAPVDQYLARSPSYLLGRAPEEAQVDPANPEILLPHLRCAAFELPFARAERYGPLDAEASRDALAYLAEHGVLHEARGRYHWVGDGHPASGTKLRSTGWENFVVVDALTGRAIAELDWRSAHAMLHERAIYQHDAEQYEVERLDYEGHRAHVRRVQSDYFTQAVAQTRVSVLQESESRPFGGAGGAAAAAGAAAGWGDVQAVERVTAFKKVRFVTHEPLGYGEVHLPDMHLQTTACWLRLPPALFRRARLGRASAVDALDGVAQALAAVCSVALLCDAHDLRVGLGDGIHGDLPPRGPEERWADEYRNFEPTLFLYDAHPGGVGFAQRIYARLEALWGEARRLVEGCPCPRGCPACVGPPDDAFPVPRKSRAWRVFEALAPAAPPEP
ncbi:MAG TPA: DEAD/DEAH box helicase [Polyangiaceae bacterium]|nr:DEAD/DEAH box helicase [Polyangiaceae bacterium]